MNRCRTSYRQVQLGLLSQQTFYGHQSEEHEGWALPCSTESGAHYSGCASTARDLQDTHIAESPSPPDLMSFSPSDLAEV